MCCVYDWFDCTNLQILLIIPNLKLLEEFLLKFLRRYVTAVLDPKFSYFASQDSQISFVAIMTNLLVVISVCTSLSVRYMKAVLSYVYVYDVAAVVSFPTCILGMRLATSVLESLNILKCF